ncbi:unnamed protein product [Linum trigynum]|uniref:S-protein homolog n=1 Tax=Linum trigynum TaxID=586398 RepID=A0AAV2D3B6_9ROSI
MIRRKKKQQQHVITVAITTATVIMARALISVDARIINITNTISSEKALIIIHCASADDDLGARAMNSGEVYSWHFEDNWRPFRDALFWCHLALEDKRLSFDAYVERPDRLGYAVLGYDVNETGVYGPDMFNMSRAYGLLHAWRQIRELH